MILLHWLLIHLPHVLLAAAVGLPDLGATASTTPPLVEGGNEPSESSEAESSEAEVFSEEKGAETTSANPGKDGKTSVDAKIDWKTVSPEVKAHIQEITKTNPKLGNLIQNAVYTSQSFVREFPGGLKQAKALKASIEEVGGLEEIKTLRQTHEQLVAEQEIIDNQAREGNPEVIETLVNIAGPEGFSKLAPVLMDKWAAVDSAGYSHVLGKIMVNAMREGGVVADLNMAFRMLNLKNEAATKEAMDCLHRIADWANNVNRIAVKPPEKPKVDPKIEEQQKNIDIQKTEIFNKEFSSSFGSWRNKAIDDQVRVISNGRQLNDYQMKTLGNRIVSDIQDILTADSDYMQKLNKIYATRDMVELNKFCRSRTLKLLPEVTKKAYRALFSNPTATKKSVAGAKPGENAATASTQSAVKGWVRLDAKNAPTPDQIDSKKTSFEMKFRQQAILKDGRKVYWGNRIPADK